MTSKRGSSPASVLQSLSNPPRANTRHQFQGYWVTRCVHAGQSGLLAAGAPQCKLRPALSIYIGINRLPCFKVGRTLDAALLLWSRKTLSLSTFPSAPEYICCAQRMNWRRRDKFKWDICKCTLRNCFYLVCVYALGACCVFHTYTRKGEK